MIRSENLDHLQDYMNFIPATEMGEHDEKSNIIVNYLPQTLTDEEFRQMFQSIGPVKSSKIIRDKVSLFSYGFGFVEYVNPDDAHRAIADINGLQLQNKTLKVAIARPPGDATKNTNLYIRGLPRNMTQQGLEEEFQRFGGIVRCKVLVNENGVSRGVGFVLFENKEDAEAALKDMNGKTLAGATEKLFIKFAEDNSTKVRPPAQDYLCAPYPPAPPKAPMYGSSCGYGPPGPMRNQGSRYNRYNPMSNTYNSNAITTSMPPQPGASNEGHALFVYNVGQYADENTIGTLFAHYGVVKKVHIIRDASKGNLCKNYCFVTMSSYNDACAAISALNGIYYLTDYALQVSFKTAKAEI